MDNTFNILFNRYRLKAEFETLTQFGHCLAQEGYIYEDSIFSRWKNGDRIPRDRKLLLTIIKIFVKRGGITHLSEANALLESTEQRDLSATEIAVLFIPEGLILKESAPIYNSIKRNTYKPTQFIQPIMLTHTLRESKYSGKTTPLFLKNTFFCQLS